MLRDLIAAETPLRKVAGTRGGEYAGACPWCGGRDRFRVWPDADRPGYWYRQCGKHGDALQYLRDRHDLSYREACEKLHVPTRERLPWPVSPPAAPTPPSDTWQARALEIVEAAARRLWEPTGRKALAYLQCRRFCDATIRQGRLGYHPCEMRDVPERWGLPPDHKPVWLPRGVTIPVQGAGAPWMLWIRRPIGEPKYLAVTESKHYDSGIDAVRFGHPALLVEAILDALAVQQAAGDLVAPVALGTRHGTPHTIGRLALAKPLLLALDADEAGEASATWWHRIFPQARRWRPTQDDPAAMLQAGQDVRGWIEQGVGQPMIEIVVQDRYSIVKAPTCRQGLAKAEVIQWRRCGPIIVIGPPDQGDRCCLHPCPHRVMNSASSAGVMAWALSYSWALHLPMAMCGVFSPSLASSVQYPRGYPRRNLRVLLFM